MEQGFMVDTDVVDSEALDAELKRRVEERKEAGVYTRDVEAIMYEPLSDAFELKGELPPASEIDYAATRASTSWEMVPHFPVGTQKKYLRAVILVVKKAGLFVLRIIAGPIFAKQSSFNRNVALALDAVRRQALEESARAKAEEEDLSELMEVLIEDQETEALASAITESLGRTEVLTVLTSCPNSLASSLEGRGYDITWVSAGTAWDQAPGPAEKKFRSTPLAFLSQIPENSTAAILVGELAFWLDPAALLVLASRSFLALKSGGALAVAVHDFALNAPAPAWCSPKVVTRALEIAGFEDVSVVEGRKPEKDRAASSYAAIGRKP